MNPLTNVRNVSKLNEQDLRNCIFDHTKTWHSQYKDSAYLFLGGLPYDLSEGDILCVFSQYGEIVNLNLVRDKKTGKSKGYGFLCYEDQRSTILAVDNFNAMKLGGRTIRVDHVTEYRVPKSDEKGEDGKFKDKIETGCAPRTPSPVPPSTDEQLAHDKSEKKKKKKKEKKKKKKKERGSSSENEGIVRASRKDEMVPRGNEQVSRGGERDLKDDRKPPIKGRSNNESSWDRKEDNVKSDKHHSSEHKRRRHDSRSPSVERKQRRDRSTSVDAKRRKREYSHSHSPEHRRRKSRSRSPDRYRSSKDNSQRRR